MSRILDSALGTHREGCKPTRGRGLLGQARVGRRPVAAWFRPNRLLAQRVQLRESSPILGAVRPLLRGDDVIERGGAHRHPRVIEHVGAGGEILVLPAHTITTEDVDEHVQVASVGARGLSRLLGDREARGAESSSLTRDGAIWAAGAAHGCRARLPGPRVLRALLPGGEKAPAAGRAVLTRCDLVRERPGPTFGGDDAAA